MDSVSSGTHDNRAIGSDRPVLDRRVLEFIVLPTEQFTSTVWSKDHCRRDGFILRLILIMSI